MDTINVALAGATGNLGPAVLNALLTEPQIKVTQLQRAGSKKGTNRRAPSREVDFTSLDSLTSALQGEDVLVSTLGFGPVGLDVHLRLIDASLAAGVQRVIPSEFGVDTSNPRTGALPIFQEKIDVQKHLREICGRSAALSYTLLFNGPFLDYGLREGFLLNLASCLQGGPDTNSGSGAAVEIFDGGDQKFSTTTQAGAGRAVVGIVTHLEMTRNKIVYVREADVSQKQLLRLAGDKKVEMKEVRTVDLESQGYAEVQKEKPDWGVATQCFLRRAIFGDGFGSHFEEGRLANRLVGVKEMTEEELRGLVGKYSK